MKILFTEWKDNKPLQSLVIENYEKDTRTHKVLSALEEACYKLDIMVPIWLDAAIVSFKRHSRARFTADAFVEEIPFDYLEIRVLEED